MNTNQTPNQNLIINLFSGPGAGKSTTATSIFSYLKLKEYNTEYVHEFAKDLVYENSFETLKDQLFISATQRHLVKKITNYWNKNNTNGIIVTDSPYILGCVYNCEKELQQFLINDFKNDSDKHLNIFLKRNKKYNSLGRIQSEEESIQKDNEIRHLLIDNKINFIELYDFEIKDYINKYLNSDIN